MIWSLLIQFAYCECGERVSVQFEKVEDTIFEIEWYALPSEIQRMATQQTIVLNGFANTVLTRDTFKKVNFEIMSWHGANHSHYLSL